MRWHCICFHVDYDVFTIAKKKSMPVFRLTDEYKMHEANNKRLCIFFIHTKKDIQKNIFIKRHWLLLGVILGNWNLKCSFTFYNFKAMWYFAIRRKSLFQKWVCTFVLKEKVLKNTWHLSTIWRTTCLELWKVL